MITFKQFNNLIKEAHDNAVSHGFYDGVSMNPAEIRQRQMLIVCEIAEAMEADRKKRWLIDQETLFSELRNIVDGLSECDDFNSYYNLFVKGCVEEELADICIRCFDMLAFMDAKIEFIDETFGHVKSHQYKDDGLLTTFSDLCHKLTSLIMPCHEASCTDIYLPVYFLFYWCDYNVIDLLTHIIAKMMYNTNIPYKHGKAY